MRIVAIGDPHGNLARLKRMPLKGADLILVTGDLGDSDLMRKRAFESIRRQKKGLPPIEYCAAQHKQAFMQAFTSSVRVMRYLAKFAPVYTIYGNVESSDRETKEYARALGLPLPSLSQALRKIPGVHVVGHKLVRFRGLRIGALDYFVDKNWVETFVGKKKSLLLKSAALQSAQARTLLSKWGRVHILLCHQPPFGVLDKVNSHAAPKHWRGKRAGSKTILDYIKKKRPAFVFCGHIHEAHGMKKIGTSTVYNLGNGSHAIIETLP